MSELSPVTTKPAMQSKTIKGSLMSLLMAIGAAMASAFVAASPEWIALLQMILPDMLDGLAVGLVPTIGSFLTGLFTVKTIQGRKEANTKIDGIF